MLAKILILGMTSTLLLSAPLARTAESFIIIDDTSGFVLASKERDEKRQIASLTKIATAMVVFDWAQMTNADLGELVTVPESAVGAGGINPAGLQAGDLISLRDLLYCALMASDNIAAHTLAYHIGRRLPNPEGLGPEGNFVAHMNALARHLGMKRTRFLNPSGLDNIKGSKPFSTAADMARLTRYAYSKSAFPFYVAQSKREVHFNRQGQQMDVWLTNTNPLLDRNGIDGVKTGRTAAAGDCIVLSADRQPESKRDGDTVYITPRRIVVVLLGTQDRSGEGMAMVERGWQLYDAWAADGRKVAKGDTLQ